MYKEQGGAGLETAATSPLKSSLCIVNKIASTLSLTLASKGSHAATI